MYGFMYLEQWESVRKGIINKQQLPRPKLGTQIYGGLGHPKIIVYIY